MKQKLDPDDIFEAEADGSLLSWMLEEIYDLGFKEAPNYEHYIEVM